MRWTSKVVNPKVIVFPRALARGNNLEGWQLNVHLVDEDKGNEPFIVEFYTWSTQT
jgi:hypothetical protein